MGIWYNKNFIIRFLVWLFFSIILMYYAFTQKPYPTGDAIEYIFMTEAFINHYSPDIRYEDYESFYKDQSIRTNWQQMGKQEWFTIFADTIRNFTSGKTDTLYKKEWHGLVGSANKKVYSIHFFIYPLLNVPVRLLIKQLRVEPLKTFQITNVLIFSLVLCMVLFGLQLSLTKSIILFFMLLFTPAYWYLGWVHADVMICMFTFLGLLLFYTQKPITGMLLVALAGTQNQPLVFLLMYMGFVYWHKQKYSMVSLTKAFITCSVIFIPALFYYINFNQFSLISKSGYTGTEYASFSRFYSFFFDLNQGLIYGLPVILPLFILMFVKNIIHQKISIHYLLIVAVLAMVYGFSVLKLWNMGQAIISRYAAWIAYIFIAFFIKLLVEHKVRHELFYATAFAHIAVFFALTPVPKNILIPEWDADKLKWPAVFMLENFPQYYNPDPDIFSARVAQKHAEWSNLPIIYVGKDKKIKKVLIKKNNPALLLLPGVDSAHTLNLQQQASYNKLGYAYINQHQIYVK